MILVTGSTGLVGEQLSQVLATGRRPVVELARGLESRYGFSGEERRFVRGDLEDPEILQLALSGVESVLHLAGHVPGRTGFAEGMEERRMQTLLTAAQAQGLDRFVYLSASGAAEASSVAWLRGKGRAEQLLRDSGLPFVILRPGPISSEQSPFFHALAVVIREVDALRLPFFCRGHLRTISVGDVAIALATALDHPKMLGQTIELGGPDVLSLAELLTRIAERMRRSLRILQRPSRARSLEDLLRPRIEHAEQIVRWFAVSEAPDVEAYDRLIPMRRLALREELRGYPWGMPPPRPGEPLPVFQPQGTGLPAFIPGAHLREKGDPAAPPPSSMGRVDPFGRVEGTRKASDLEPGAEPGDARPGETGDRS